MADMMYVGKLILKTFFHFFVIAAVRVRLNYRLIC